MHKRRYSLTRAATTRREERSASNSCCCGALHIKRGAILIAVLSLISSIINATLLCFGISRTAFNIFVEIGILLADFTATLTLLYGVLCGRAAFLKPYLFINVLWNLLLLLLLVICIVQIIKGDGMARNITHNVLDMLRLQPTRSQMKLATALSTIFMVGGLGITIAANFWFLYVVFLCFQWMNAHDGGEDKPTSTFIEERSVTAAKPVIVDGVTGTPSPSNTTNSTSNSNHRNVTAKLLNQPPSLLTRPEIRLPVPPLKFRSGVSYYADHGRYRPRLPA